MENLSHYIWENKEEEEHKHYVACEKAGEPYIILKKEDGEYVSVSYDSITMFDCSFRNDSEESVEEIDRKYKNTCRIMKKIQPEIVAFFQAYYKTFSLPRKRIASLGAEGAFSFIVFKEHADFIAEGLYHYLAKSKPRLVATAKKIHREVSLRIA